MFPTRRTRHPPSDQPAAPTAALQAFREVAGLAERAKEALLTAVPRGRGAGAPVAEALGAFEELLRAARRTMERWPPSMAEAERRDAAAAIEESLRRAEGLRLDASPQGYEELYALLGDALDPLDALAEVGERLRKGSGRPSAARRSPSGKPESPPSA